MRFAARTGSGWEKLPLANQNLFLGDVRRDWVKRAEKAYNFTPAFLRTAAFLRLRRPALPSSFSLATTRISFMAENLRLSKSAVVDAGPVMGVDGHNWISFLPDHFFGVFQSLPLPDVKLSASSASKISFADNLRGRLTQGVQARTCSSYVVVTDIRPRTR